ncbi:hypothetical protein EHF36_10060 [Kerstersia gyiorum]|nr:hypothetical protein EHF36_10060 [Kerstersia gyiorum]
MVIALVLERIGIGERRELVSGIERVRFERTRTVLYRYRQRRFLDRTVRVLQTIGKDIFLTNSGQRGRRRVRVAAIGIDGQHAIQARDRRAIGNRNELTASVLHQELGVGRAQMIVSQHIAGCGLNVLDDVFIQVRDRLSLVRQLQLTARSSTATLIRGCDGVVASLKALQHLLDTQVAKQPARTGVGFGVAVRTCHRHLQAIGNKQLIR